MSNRPLSPQPTQEEIERLENIERRLDKLEPRLEALVKELEESDRLIDELEGKIRGA